MTITTELKQAVARAGTEPVWVEDPEANRAYVLIAAEEFERMRALLSDDPVEQIDGPVPGRHLQRGLG